ncbi:hypothetical protein yc1106_05121 [Curvularia clavata]|uniref:RelA/SpoT domain-containing protein n=1 Tax=Curvularia clavata TaxID=95742 RepID=A0A9Q8Z7J2_CURCL|nr:hypothetical protein yc1106_05121 [Curvularia clavata]
MSSYNTEPRRSSDLSIQDHEDIGRIRALNRTMTYLNTPAQSAIKEFLSVAYHIEHYEALAKRAQKLLEAALKDARDSDKVEVQFRITCRAKTIKSLEEKLQARDKTRNYRTVRDILEDVPDLAGVRIVLYTPNKAQRSRVKEAIKEIWGDGVEERLHGDPVLSRKANSSKIHDKDADNNDEDAMSSGRESEEYVPKHLGYQADHYRALMRKDQQDDSYKYKEIDKVEIQVVSALGHVWAEAGHDVMYKTHAYGNPTKLERRILDALSGLITSGDLLLEEFRESVTKRTYARWRHREDLAMWLRESDVMKQKGREDEKKIHKTLDYHFGAAGIDILYKFLSKTDNNYPIAVRNILKTLDFPKNPISGLKNELARFGDGFVPPHGLLAPFCVLSRLLPKSEEPLDMEAHNVSQKCSIMMDAFILLQTFSGTAAAAKHYLLDNVELTKEEMESIDFVLSDPLRRDCLSNFGNYLEQDLQVGWDWFVQQAIDDKLCGFLFRLALLDVSAEETYSLERLEKLQIKPLSRQSTFDDNHE